MEENKNIVKEKKTFKKLMQKVGFGLLGATVLYYLYFSVIFYEETSFADWGAHHHLILYLMLLGSAILIFDFTQILFDPREQDANLTKPKLVKKLRFRAILFNNIAILLFLFTFAIIIICLYIFISPTEKALNDTNWISNLTLRGGATILLVFLVQIFFNVFKYMLRVAAFYNARADAIEFAIMDVSKDLEKLMESFTPDKYDISNLEKIDLMGDLINSVKGKSK